MIEHLPSRNLRVAVIGGGFSGAVFAVQLARKATVGVAIDIIEPRTLLGAGVAYSTTDPSHRINVPATKMSVFRDAPAHFAEWLQKDTELASDPAASWPTGQAYPRRVVFGRYVASLVESARRMRPDVTIHHVRETVGGIERRDGGYAVQLVAGGNGLGLVPLPLLQASRHEAALDVLTLSDFKPLIDIWLVHPRVLGKLQQPVERFGAAVERQFKAARLQSQAA